MRFEIYKDNAEEFRWRAVASNGKIIADSAEGYDVKAGCRAGIALLREGLNSGDMVIEDLTIDMEQAESAGRAVAEIERRRRDDDPDPIDVEARDGIGS